MTKMDIWDAVSKTDPSHTKKVSQRGGFTAIDASYQVMNATAQFGPIGVGWGYVAGDPIFTNGTVIVPVTMWHGDRSNVFGPEYGCEMMVSKGRDGNERIDTDAPKKATTDALTKLLSRLGFNADVFLGKFDDSKYVQERAAEVRKENAPKPTPEERMKRMDAAMKKCDDANALNDLWNSGGFKAAYSAIPENLRKQLDLTFSGMMDDFA
ncbi:MAG: hypothetical protein Unbinned7865contig1001_42 [Prokaryotic dsDNA virus sp.]|nr:MAG: hypothetical protein Unbinned7865contig1001_42 [Prokaryotic dsDNA virus sp.]|tara:strand:+ start:8420 stop:9049 length:630 start_codon:yes stop_codon:yes gene_type:complete